MKISLNQRHHSVCTYAGGIAGSFITFTLPAMLYLKIMPATSALYSIAKAVFALGCFTAVAVLTATIVEHA
jgi:hypothetical protein